MAKAEIPTISFGPFLKGTPEEREKVAQQVYDAFHTIGFLYLENSGISQERVDFMFGLAKKFFELPDAFKKRFAVDDPSNVQGYTGRGTTTDFAKSKNSDHKEAYEHRRQRQGNPNCPPGEEMAKFDPDLVNFKAEVDAFYHDCMILSKEVLRCLALALKVPGGEHHFDSMMENSDSIMRLTHYPSVPASIITGSKAAAGQKDDRIRPHCDYGFCTLLFQDSTGGLEVDPFHTGEFIPAIPKSGTVLINIADLLHRLLNGRVKSTIHRVVAPLALPATEGEDPMLPYRYSIPFFVHPDPSTTIAPILLEENEVQRYKTINAGVWKNWRTARNYKRIDQEQMFLKELGIANEIAVQ